MLVTHLFTSMSWEMWTFSYLLLLLRLCKLFRTIFWRTWTWLLMITIQAKPSSMFAFWLLSFPLNWVSFLFGLACSIHRKTDSPCSLQEAWKWRLDSNSNDGLVRHCYRAMWFEEQGPILCHSCTAWIMGRVHIWSIQLYISVIIKAEIIPFLYSGFIADTILYLSYYFTANELTIRLSFFWVSLTTSNIISALLAGGILRLRGNSGLYGWQWLFALEGTVTFLIGLWLFFYLPASPTQTITRWRKKPWFTEWVFDCLFKRCVNRSISIFKYPLPFCRREESIIVNKVLRDDPTKSQSD